MKTLTLTRTYSPKYTAGMLTDETGDLKLVTLELPSLNNAPDKSCIPEGMYTCLNHNGSDLAKADCWALQNVPSRSGILIHIGNTTEDTVGCILVGLHSDSEGAIYFSTRALQVLRDYIGKDAAGKNLPFILVITNIKTLS